MADAMLPAAMSGGDSDSRSLHATKRLPLTTDTVGLLGFTCVVAAPRASLRATVSRGAPACQRAQGRGPG